MRLFPITQTSWIWALVFAMIACFWGSASTGIVSSNDGSHLALARALTLRGKPEIDEDVALTLGIDVAWREGHYYSDRPPGTAFAAMWAVYLGKQLDHAILSASRRAGTMLLQPASSPFIFTYAKRTAKAPPLAGLMATASIISLHTIFLGIIGLYCVRSLLHRWGIGRGGQLFACCGLALATLWGPYSTTLYSHGSSITAMATSLMLIDKLRNPDQDTSSWPAFGLGVLIAWAVSCDYVLSVVFVPMIALMVQRKHWKNIGLASLPGVFMTMAYHTWAFGRPWSIGYDYQQHFTFARSRMETFDGSLFDGLWVLWGAGRGAGLLAQSPIVLMALAIGLIGAKPCSIFMRKVFLAMIPWILLLAMHQSPWGGGTLDHRYLSPILPLAGLGLGIAWSKIQEFGPRKKNLCYGVLWLCFAFSSVRVWGHFLGTHEGELGMSWWVGVVAGFFTFLLVFLFQNIHLFDLSVKQDDDSILLN